MPDDPSKNSEPRPEDKSGEPTPDAAKRPPIPGVRPITLKPPVAPPVRPSPPSGGGTPSGDSSAKPSGPAPTASSGPATIRLKPVTRPAGAAPGGASATPSGPTPAAGSDGDAPTVRLRPMVAAQPTVTSSAPKPGAAPLPPGPKPLKPEQAQAAKAKTSRISLDAALVGGQDGGGGPKTIRLKRPTDAPVGKITSHLGAAASGGTSAVRGQGGRVSSPLIPPVSAGPSKPVVNRFTTAVETPDPDAPGAGSSGGRSSGQTVGVGLDGASAQDEGSSITRRKTIRVKRAGGSQSFKDSIKATSKTQPDTKDLAGDIDEDGGQTPLRAPIVIERMHWLFPTLAVASVFILIALVVVLIAPDRNIAGGATWPSSSPTIRLPGMAPIPGRQ